MNASTLAPRARRIVVRGVNWLGDAVMSTPALMRLREAYPEAFIVLVTPEKLGPLWEGHPAVNSVLSFAAGEGALKIGRRLRDDAAELGLVLPNSFRSALELWYAGIPRRVGYGGQWRRWLLTEIVNARPGAVRMHKRSDREVQHLVKSGGSVPTREEGRPPPGADPAHHIFQYLHLVQQLGANSEAVAPRLFVREDEVEQLHSRLRKSGSEREPYFGLNPGAEYGPAKRWPAERFIAAARAVQEQTGCSWLVFGGKGDVALAEEIAAGIRSGLPDKPARVLNLAGKTSLRELCAAFKLCRLVLTNDTGPMHVAAAVGTPVVVPFGSTSVRLTGPGLPGSGEHRLIQAVVPCSPCFLRECPIDFRCMTSIEAEPVVAAILSTWRRSLEARRATNSGSSGSNPGNATKRA